MELEYLNCRWEVRLCVYEETTDPVEIAQRAETSLGGSWFEEDRNGSIGGGDVVGVFKDPPQYREIVAWIKNQGYTIPSLDLVQILTSRVSLEEKAS
jgi:hypothetical protein